MSLHRFLPREGAYIKFLHSIISGIAKYFPKFVLLNYPKMFSQVLPFNLFFDILAVDKKELYNPNIRATY